MDSIELRITTGDRLFTDLSGDLDDFCDGRGDGLANVWVPHATAGVALFELGAGSELDVEAAIRRLLPPEAGYTHRHGSAGHGADHVLPAFVSPSVTIPVLAGRPQLGTWQRLVLVDPNRDNPQRRFRLSFLG
jgi:secondary thiamine-phosphate synthase enzyme